MIKELKVQNFLSLKNVDLGLRPLNVLVGPNMSGKSNLIESLKFLQDALSRQMGDGSPFNQAFSTRGGFHEVVWKGQPEGPIAFELEAELPERFLYEVVVRWNSENGFPIVDSEKLTANRGRAAQTILESCSGKSRVTDSAGTISEGPQNTLGLDLEARARWPSFQGCKLWRFISNWQFYHLVPALMRQSNAPEKHQRLTEHGENLSAWLLTVQNFPSAFRRIKQVCCDVLPGFDEIVFQPIDAPRHPVISNFSASSDSAKISVGASEQRFASPFGIARMSDGELAFLSLMSLILAPEELAPPLICIEEPENYLHPRLLEVLVEVLKQRLGEPHPPQIIATTHSLQLVDKLEIDDLIVAERIDGASRFTRPGNKRHFKELLSSEDLSLGDLLFSGALTDS
jgi:predicted ATPase